ncbi:YHS domain-containing protein [Leifsonia shinshuensis]|uniref:YHS domain-containing protein n=1 Tax=Leifsonia shinshuensis TaxID=150026 RepID=UPI001F5145EC|nr:YHS domain-containing protein [Leifsonia shinshuensis]MCI0156522.1 YHS domain-containing protein [Leifsonia shinshuensis]
MTDNHHHTASAHEHHHGVPTGTQNLLGPTATDLAECPVMQGSLVVKADAEAAGLYRDYEGTRYYLCCAGCGPKFDADPARYATA